MSDRGAPIPGAERLPEPARLDRPYSDRLQPLVAAYTKMHGGPGPLGPLIVNRLTDDHQVETGRRAAGSVMDTAGLFITGLLIQQSKVQRWRSLAVQAPTERIEPRLFWVAAETMFAERICAWPPAPCPECDGGGLVRFEMPDESLTDSVSCPECAGLGRVPVTHALWPVA